MGTFLSGMLERGHIIPLGHCWGPSSSFLSNDPLARPSGYETYYWLCSMATMTGWFTMICNDKPSAGYDGMATATTGMISDYVRCSM